ncbi:MAG TPA: outer membrane beta-barrel protein [Flavisolibacter sp.]|nr:outer membrane beta-barrel protein [Flavisolibacter sp.]
MQHLNDDMDELFRRAAGEYPLNTGGADWEKMQALLSSEQTVPVPKKGRKKHFLWLLLLLPVALICNRVTDNNRSLPASQNTKEATAASGINRARNNAAPSVQSNITTQSTGTTEEAQTNGTHETDLTVAEQSVVKKKVIQGKESIGQDASVFQQPNPVAESESLVQHKAVAKEQNAFTPAATQPVVTTGALHQFVADQLAMTSPTQMIAVSDLKNDVAGTMIVANNANLKPVESSSAKRRFYVGAVAGPDVSTVKFQQFSEIGFAAGVLLGYQLSERFAIEAGALSSKKYYYSEGEYLNTSKIYLPPNSKIVAVDGNCRMVELPLSLQYTFSKKQAHAWFVSSGLSSYLMKKEDYTYDYLYLTTGNVVSYSKTYTNETKNWVSILQLSAGYTHKLGAAGNLRLEPYYSIPLKGIGYGSLPISSLGLRIGITSKHF